jgi:indole-3-glycerol phosphate synthase
MSLAFHLPTLLKRRQETLKAKKHLWRETLLNEAPTSQRASLTPQDFNVWLEIKPASPALGALATPSFSPETQALAYRQYGQGISILTENDYFHGSPELFQQVQQSLQSNPIGLLWKDFVIDPFQIELADHLGASGILLIVKCLDKKALTEFYQESLERKLLPVVEVQTEAEVDIALELNPSLLLINNRNLETLDIDLNTTKQLSPRIPNTVQRISASGIDSREKLDDLRAYCDGVLIGSNLMQSVSQADLHSRLRALTQ